MEVPQTFVLKDKDTRRKIKELMDACSKEESYVKELELLKKGQTQEKKKSFLESFAKNLPDFIEKVREKMEQTSIDRIYLDNPEDYKIRDYGYRTRLEIRSDGHLYFIHYISGMGFKSDLDEDYYKNYWSIHEYLDTYPDKENIYSSLSGGDTLDRSFKEGREMYERIKSFLEEK